MTRLAAAAFGLAAVSCAHAPAPTGEEVFLRLAGPLDSWHLHLRADGTFQFYRAEHFQVLEGLEGTWRRTGPESAALHCDRWARLVVSEPIRVRLGRDWQTHRAHIRKALETFLAEHAGRPTFTKDELEETATWDEKDVTHIPISATEDVVPRAAVEKVILLLEAYDREDPREVHVRFHRHRSIEFMEWLDWSGYTDPVSPAAIRAEIDRLAPGETPADAWVRLAREEVEREFSGKDGLRFFKR
jgi:hypothetical protein